MAKRPSLFSTPKPIHSGGDKAIDLTVAVNSESAEIATGERPPSRVGKRVLSIYLDPLAWKQLRQLALDSETTTQALGEEAVNLLFAKHRLNRTA